MKDPAGGMGDLLAQETLTAELIHERSTRVRGQAPIPHCCSPSSGTVVRIRRYLAAVGLCVPLPGTSVQSSGAGAFGRESPCHPASHSTVWLMARGLGRQFSTFDSPLVGSSKRVNSSSLQSRGSFTYVRVRTCMHVHLCTQAHGIYFFKKINMEILV